ncbi:hypothetical protein XI09_06825 [Bradyrhizobium sp. CCBAU 11386]|nr:hypothetical protein [Bradyrhizobium sp. CCBAU 11386]
MNCGCVVTFSRRVSQFFVAALTRLTKAMGKPKDSSVAAQTVQLFHRRIERIHVDMDDLAVRRVRVALL